MQPNCTKPALVIILMFTLFISSCMQETQPTKSSGDLTMMNDTLLKYNKGVVKAESQEIEDFARRHQWPVSATSTGIRYFIYKHGVGQRAKRGDTAYIHFETRLIDGELCYSSKQDGIRKVPLGRSSTEVGLQEGILLMKQGDQAKLIVPSHLAFGLLGDQGKIPPQSTLIYDVELIQLK